ncbi:hypothetical protein I302_107260 [Kwoniella bestiolae CBS 10118]|uniref:Uncharacterized protein n=1 Tax=Kwoniella bestiolae CBS 10118 TaxID=1296100 RepID=A0A1B9FZ18_9TREE|nr:hypothetical protein I302_07004 [Kwoniella bestiolae CBS 10118]OCF24018.1 hypothetical protein I302_07004 [Kwoniella bestiolae CBS 10118]
MASIEDRFGTRPLRVDELWKSWPVLKVDGMYRVLDGSLPPNASTTVPIIYPTIRTDHSLSSNTQLVSRMKVRRLKLQIVRDILNSFYDLSSVEINVDYDAAWDLLRSPGRSMMGLVWRMDQAREENTKGIEAEDYNKHRKAIYHFALGWVHLIPYHVDAFEALSDLRMGLAKLEKDLFSNMRICAQRLAASPTIGIQSKHNLWRLSYTSSLINLTSYFAMTAQEVFEHITRLYEVSEELRKIPDTPYDYLTGQTLFIIRKMEDFVDGKPKDLELWFLDRKVSLRERRRLESQEIRRLELREM